MRLAVVSDIHANLVAFEAVLSDMPPVDGYLCAGDVVGYGPWPAECVDRLRELGAPTIMGNHDRAVATETGFGFNSMADAGVRYASEQLSQAQIEWLRSLPDERVEHDGRVKIVHGHPDDPDRYTYPGLFKPAMLADEDVLIMGHTHVQAHEVFDEGIVMNPGSVGQPRDEDPRAAYSLLDLDAMTVEERRVEYDIDAVVEAVDEADLPAKIGKRLRKGR